MSLKSTLVIGVFILLAIITVSNIAQAMDLKPMPPTPGGNVPPPSSGGGSSSGSGGSFNTPQFQPYTISLKTSNGSVIGSLAGKNFNSVLVQAETNSTIDNTFYDLSIAGELSSKPADECWLDIVIARPDTSWLPKGMESGLTLATLNITASPQDWSYKDGSPTYTLKIIGLNKTLSPDATYYLVRSDGSGYQILPVAIDTADNNVSVKFTPPGNTGVFTIIEAAASAPLLTSTPTPTAEPIVVPGPTVAPDNGYSAGMPIVFGTLILGVILGVIGTFLVFRTK